MHGFFVLLGDQPIVFLLLALAIGYPLGRLSLFGISLGSTAGVLIAAVVMSMIAESGFGLTYSIPSILSSVFLLFFMYALGLKVGPQFFSGLRSGAVAYTHLTLPPNRGVEVLVAAGHLKKKKQRT